MDPRERSIYAAIDNMRLILAFLGKSHIVSTLRKRARRAPLNLIAPSCSGKRDSQKRAICFLTHFQLSW